MFLILVWANMFACLGSNEISEIQNMLHRERMVNRIRLNPSVVPLQFHSEMCCPLFFGIRFWASHSIRFLGFSPARCIHHFIESYLRQLKLKNNKMLQRIGAIPSSQLLFRIFCSSDHWYFHFVDTHVRCSSQQRHYVNGCALCIVQCTHSLSVPSKNSWGIQIASDFGVVRRMQRFEI